MIRARTIRRAQQDVESFEQAWPKLVCNACVRRYTIKSAHQSWLQVISVLIHALSGRMVLSLLLVHTNAAPPPVSCATRHVERVAYTEGHTQCDPAADKHAQTTLDDARTSQMRPQDAKEQATQAKAKKTS